jgi:hypothetical protein
VSRRRHRYDRAGRGGYYLVYAPAELATGNLVFYDERGQVVDELDSPHA